MDQYQNDDYGDDNQLASDSEGSHHSYSGSEQGQQEENREQAEEQGSDWTLQEQSQQTQVQEMLANMQILQEEHFWEAQKRITAPMLTKYEKAMLIGVRATQVSKGSPIYLNLTKTELETWSPIQIAESQLQEGVIPFIVRRIHPDGKFEDWKLSEFKNLDK